MRRRLCFALIVAATASGAAVSVRHPAQAAPQLASDLPIPFLPFSYPPDGSRMMGTFPPSKPGSNPGVTAPLVPAAPKPAPPPVRTRAEMLDDLFHRLAVASDSDEAVGVASRIQRLWLESGSDTVDLLMSRAADAVGHGNSEVASSLLDSVVVLDPDWAEGWNKRATLRFQHDDDDGAMSDIAHVLALEPRHYGAMTGMAMILNRHGLKKDALAVLRAAAVIYPKNGDLNTMIETLTPEVEGRPI